MLRPPQSRNAASSRSCSPTSSASRRSSEGRDAEETRELLTRYFELAGEVIGRYGGTIEKFIGDAVMAVWGAPVAHEDDAERAVRAALELVDAVQALGPGIHARAGVLTGEAAVTIGATNQGMVAGDIVNTARRLQSVAPPGTVLVGESTERAANQAIAFEPAGEQVLKGKAGAGARVARAPRRRRARRRGRGDRSRRRSSAATTSCGCSRTCSTPPTARGGRASCRSSGRRDRQEPRSPGSSSKYIDGLVETVWWHTGRSPAYGEGITFWALGEMVRSRAGLAETDDEPTTRAKVARGDRAHGCRTSASGAGSRPALLVLLGLDTATPMAREELFAAWRTFFERIAAEGTVVLVFEDLHWADPGMLDFIDHLLEWSRGVPIFVVTLARPELLERRPDWGAGRRNFVALDLEPLSDGRDRELLGRARAGPARPPMRAIVARADGIPLYAVETVRMLVAEGRLVAGTAATPDGRPDRPRRPGDAARADRRPARRA